VFAAAADRLPPLEVEVVPSHEDAVLLEPPAQPLPCRTCDGNRSEAMVVALCDSSVACSQAASLVVSRPHHVRAPA
jgi:hypothetical protein